MTDLSRAAIRKSDFSSIYDQPDPRSYYRVLDEYDYQTPAHARRVFRRLLDAQRRTGERAPAVFDLCCSYGMVGALLACDVTWADLCDRYNDRSLDHLPAAKLVAADRAWYAQRRLADAPRVAGLDVAARAVAYGELAGLLQPGLVDNLEERDPADAVEGAVCGVGLVTASGGVSYLTERTFGRLLKLFKRPPWVATFVLRAYDYGAIAKVCAGHGLVTERLDGVTFRQRRFASDEERKRALGQLAARGRDPSLEADDGYYHTQLFVSRPADEAAHRPLAQLLADVAAGRAPRGQHQSSANHPGPSRSGMRGDSGVRRRPAPQRSCRAPLTSTPSGALYSSMAASATSIRAPHAPAQTGHEARRPAGDPPTMGLTSEEIVWHRRGAQPP